MQIRGNLGLNASVQQDQTQEGALARLIIPQTQFHSQGRRNTRRWAAVSGDTPAGLLNLNRRGFLKAADARSPPQRASSEQCCAALGAEVFRTRSLAVSQPKRTCGGTCRQRVYLGSVARVSLWLLMPLFAGGQTPTQFRRGTRRERQLRPLHEQNRASRARPPLRGARPCSRWR